MLQEGVDDVEQVPDKLRIRARTAGQLVAEMRLGKLRKEARGAVEHQIDAPHQLRGRQVLDRAEVDADQLGDGLERLAVHPRLAARNDGQLPRAERDQFVECAGVGEDVARDERYFMLAKELLSAQAAGSARLPVDFDRSVGGRLGHGVALLE